MCPNRLKNEVPYMCLDKGRTYRYQTHLESEKKKKKRKERVKIQDTMFFGHTGISSYVCNTCGYEESSTKCLYTN